MNLVDLKNLKLKAKDHFKITPENILDKSIQLGTLFQRYSQIHNTELLKLKTLSVEKDKLYGDLYHKKKFEGSFTLDSNKEIDIYVKADDTYYKLLVKIANQEVIVDWLEQTINNINKLGFYIKNYVDIYKFKNGDV